MVRLAPEFVSRLLAKVNFGFHKEEVWSPSIRG